MAKPHVHRALFGRHAIIGWTRCVAPVTYSPTGRERACTGASHGGVVLVDHCRCGATRRVESNGRHRASSGWIEPEGA